MPDIIITCRDCGREHKISEYAVLDRMTCLTCGAELSKPVRAPAMSLRLAGVCGPAVPPPLAREAMPTLPPHVVGPPGQSAPPRAEVRPAKMAKETPRGVSLAVAAGVGLALIGFQMKADVFADYLAVYEWARTGLLVVAYLLVVLLAFQDGLGPGALCLVIPPYSLIYATTSVESRVLPGLLFGAVVGVFAELHFLADHSLVLAVIQHFEQVVAWGDSLISAASAPLK